jgi:hypothetical protein
MTDLKRLSFNIPHIITDEALEFNDTYFQALALKKYCNIDRHYQLKCAIEHGAGMINGNLSEYAARQNINNDAPGIITMSKLSEDIYKKVCTKTHYAIGPYIAYAKNFLSDEERIKEKERLGRVLLFFPDHSIHYYQIEYDIKQIINYLKEIGKDYDTIRVCLYWKDISLGHAKKYQNAGFECVSAGQIYNENFLPRLRSIIELSDMTISNHLGTTLGYCIYLKKPHQIYRQKLVAKPGDNNKEDNSTIKNNFLNDNNSAIREMIFSAFKDLQSDIASEQYDLIDKYWGLSCIKSPEELKAIFDECETNYQHNINNNKYFDYI